MTLNFGLEKFDLMKITIGQINTTNGDITGNVAKILSAIERAKADASEMIVFPEVATHGYTSFDWFLDKDIIERSEEPLEKIIPATVGITAIVGTVRKTAGDANGRRLFNSAAVIHNGELLGYADKTLLPDGDFH